MFLCLHLVDDKAKTTSYLEHLDLAACRVQVFCVFTIFILLKGVNLHPERNPLLSSMFPWSKFCADTMYLAKQKLGLSLQTVWSCAKLSLDSLYLQCALTWGFSSSLETKRVRRVQNIFTSVPQDKTIRRTRSLQRNRTSGKASSDLSKSHTQIKNT